MVISTDSSRAQRFGRGLIQDIPLLSTETCEEILDRVLKLRSHWEAFPEAGYFGLGTGPIASGEPGRQDYLRAAQNVNHLMDEQFGALYAQILSCLADPLGTDAIQIADRLRRPGFLIFEQGHGVELIASAPGKRAHFDLPWRRFYAADHVDATLAFTLVISQPAEGSALAVWPLRISEIAALTSSIGEYVQRVEPELLPYRIGDLRVHDGRVLHAVAQEAAGAADRPRVSLQGFGVRLGARWEIFW
jgi:hypothetical protein